MDFRIALASLLFLSACSLNHASIVDDKTALSGIVRGELVLADNPLSKTTVQIYDSANPHVYCSATPIGKRTLLTARHCFISADLEDGRYKLTRAKFPFAQDTKKQVLEIESWEAHPNVDLAIATLSSEIPDDYKIAKVTSLQKLTPGPLVIAGFGRTGAKIPADGILRFGHINKNSYGSVEEKIHASIDYPDSTICPGDSGGPAFILQDGEYYLVGVTSRGDLSCESYSLFVEPAHFLKDFKSLQTLTGQSLQRNSALKDPDNQRLKYLINYPTNTIQTDKKVTVAVIDSGVSLPEQLQKNVLPGWDTLKNVAATTDRDGHGTAVAGVILNLASDAQILPMRTFANDVGSNKAITEAFIRTINQGADIVNCSCSYDEDFLRKIRDLVGKEKFQQTLIVLAAGNDGEYLPELKEVWNNIIVVGATNLTTNLSFAVYSRKGPGVDILAPAGGIDDGITTYSHTGGLRLFNGTSAAAPVVAGAAALLKKKNPALSAAELKSSLLSSSCQYEQLRSVVKDGRALNVGRLLKVSDTCPQEEAETH